MFRCVREVYPGAAVDLEYLKDEKYAHNNPMDINSTSGLALLALDVACSMFTRSLKIPFGSLL